MNKFKYKSNRIDPNKTNMDIIILSVINKYKQTKHKYLNHLDDIANSIIKNKLNG